SFRERHIGLRMLRRSRIPEASLNSSVAPHRMSYASASATVALASAQSSVPVCSSRSRSLIRRWRDDTEGLALASISRRLCQMMGGDLGVESRLDKDNATLLSVA